jgi:ATP/ADP translocase
LLSWLWSKLFSSTLLNKLRKQIQKIQLSKLFYAMLDAWSGALMLASNSLVRMLTSRLPLMVAVSALEPKNHSSW